MGVVKRTSGADNIVEFKSDRSVNELTKLPLAPLHKLFD